MPDLIGLICLIYPTQLPYKVKKGGVKMTLADYYNRNIPEYYDTMYLDGYTPDQIMTTFRKKMYRILYILKISSKDAACFFSKSNCSANP